MEGLPAITINSQVILIYHMKGITKANINLFFKFLEEERYHLFLKQQSLIVNTVLGSWVYKEVGWQRYHLLDHSGPAPRQNRPQHQANTILPIGRRLLPSHMKIPKYLSCSYQSYQLVEIFFLTSENTKIYLSFFTIFYF